MAKFKEVASGVIKDVTSHWSKPAKGNYVSYKEIVNLGIGGMGQQLITLITGCLALSAGNTLLGATLGIKPLHLQYMATVQTVFNLIFYVIRGRIVDNTRTKYGRFRPYIAIMGFPLVILSTIFMFLPFETMSYNSLLAVTFCFAITVSMVQPFYTDTYGEMQTVISPDSKERTKIITINALVYSAAPTITGLLIPILVNFTGGYTNIATYRYIYVPTALLGLGLNFFTAFGCKERVVASKSYVQRIGVIEGCLQIYRNKHWWLRTIAGIIGFLEGASGVIFMWIYIYGVQNTTQYGLLSTVLGSASGIGMAITPWVLGKLGNKKLLIFHNSMNILFLTAMTFTFKIPLLLFVFIYGNAVINSFANVYNQVMHSEVKDYQQYISGKRMDFMFGAAGLITTPITICTGYVIPYVYEYMGLTVDYDILYEPQVRNTLFLVLCCLSIVGAILNLLPFAFYSMSREKHRNIIKVLEYRAMFDDYENGCLTEDRIALNVEGIRETYKFVDAPTPDFAQLRKNVKDAKGKQAKNEASKALKEAKELMVEKEAATILTDELNKFKNPEMLHQVKRAKELRNYGIDNLTGFTKDMVREAKAQEAATKEEKAMKKYDIRRAKNLVKMSKRIKKYYPDGVEVPDEDLVEKAFNMPKDTIEQDKARSRAVERAEKILLRYGKVMKPWVEAQELLKQERISRTILDDVMKMYDESQSLKAEPAQA